MQPTKPSSHLTPPKACELSSCVPPHSTCPARTPAQALSTLPPRNTSKDYGLKVRICSRPFHCRSCPGPIPCLPGGSANRSPPTEWSAPTRSPLVLQRHDPRRTSSPVSGAHPLCARSSAVPSAGRQLRDHLWTSQSNRSLSVTTLNIGLPHDLAVPTELQAGTPPWPGAQWSRASSWHHKGTGPTPGQGTHEHRPMSTQTSGAANPLFPLSLFPPPSPPSAPSSL